jgi:hypothetical protein
MARKPPAKKKPVRKKSRKPVKKPAARKPRKPAVKKPAARKPRKPVKKPTARVPRGFKPAGQEPARLDMLSTLQRAAEYLKQADGIDSKVYFHVNKDESIDAELKVSSVRGVSTKDLSLALEQALPKQRPGLWISQGTRFAYQNDKDPYARYKGNSQIQSNYRRYTRTKSALSALTSRVITERVENKARRKVDHLFVRLHWNAADMQPKRKK